jgi:hypothetical protein
MTYMSPARTLLRIHGARTLAAAKAAQIEIPVIGGAVVGGWCQRRTPDRLNSAASGLSSMTCRARAGHGQNTYSAAGNGSQHVSQRLRHRLALETIMMV